MSEGELSQELYADLGKLFVPLVKHFKPEEGEVNHKGSTIDEIDDRPLKSIVKIGCKYVNQKGEEKTVEFLLKCRKKPDTSLPPLLRRDEKGRDREFRYYTLLEGTSGIPKAYTIEKIIAEQEKIKPEEALEKVKKMRLKVFQRSIIFDYLGNETLRDKLEEKSVRDRVGRRDVIEGVLDKLLDFQNETTQRSTTWSIDANGLGGLFEERTMKERGLDYASVLKDLKSSKSLEKKESERIVEIYNNIAEAYNRGIGNPVICHGDLTPSNIVVGKERKLYFIDPKLKWRDSMVDLCSLVSSPGVNLFPEDWEYLAKKLVISGLQKKGATVENRGVVLFGSKEIGLKEETEKLILNTLYKEVLHYSIRNYTVARASESFEEEASKRLYKGNIIQTINEMRYKVGVSLYELINSGDRLGMTNEESKLYADFKEIFQNDFELVYHKRRRRRNMNIAAGQFFF